MKTPFSLALVVLLLLQICGCATGPRPLTEISPPQADPLAELLGTLTNSTDSEEAAILSHAARNYSRTLAEEYRVFLPAHLHNLLVNSGIREKGLCYQWADELLAHLRTLKLQSYDLHEAVAHQGTWREHNAVVVTGKGTDFTAGIVLDAWRNSGDLYWSPVRDDSYPWSPRKPAIR